jgi:hypothetical protein
VGLLIHGVHRKQVSHVPPVSRALSANVTFPRDPLSSSVNVKIGEKHVQRFS